MDQGSQSFLCLENAGFQAVPQKALLEYLRWDLKFWKVFLDNVAFLENTHSSHSRAKGQRH